MPSLISLLRYESIDVLNLSADLEEKLREQKISTLLDLFHWLQIQKTKRSDSMGDRVYPEIAELNIRLRAFLDENGAKKPEIPSEEIVRPIDTTNNLQLKSEPENPFIHFLGKELVDTELIYRAKLRNIDLVGEIPTTKDELLLLAGLFGHVFSKHPVPIALEAIEKGSPASFIIFLVGQGVYGYNGGDYWTSVGVALGHHPDYRFGQAFERIIRRNRLVVFEELQKKSTKYVSLILAHGGIPVYSLDDYFSNLVLTSINRPQYSGLEGEELLNSLLSSSVVSFTDKPVIHFLEYGGRVAQDIFNRSRKLMIQWQSSQTIPTVEEVGLPRHMLDHFAEWVKTQVSTSTSIRSSKSHLKKPEFCLDPWGVGVFLKLPAQSVPISDSVDCEWKIKAGNFEQSIPVEINSQGYTKEANLRLDTVWDSYEVKFCQGEKEFEWPFNIPNTIFIFDPVRGLLINRITNREVWLIYPRHLEAKIIEGDGYQTEELPALPGNWYKMKAEGWDLSSTQKLAFVQQGVNFKEFDIKTQEEVQPPILVGGKILHTNFDSSHVDSVYIGKLPNILIPLPEVDDITEFLNRWRISIQPVGFADPETPHQFELSELPAAAITVSSGNVEIHLENELLLNVRPMGTFQVAMLGPLGQDTNFTIVCIPECEIIGIEPLFIPDRNGAPQVQVEIHTSLLDGLRVGDGSNNIKIHNSKPGIFSVTVPPETSRVSLQIVREYQDSEIVVPFDYRVRRLRWQLVTQDLLESWSNDLLDVSIASFAELSSPLMIVSLPGIEVDAANLYLRFLDIHSNELMRVLPARRSSKYSGEYWRFDLNVLQSNLLETTAPILRLQLIVEGIPEGHSIELPVVSFTRAIDVRYIKAELQNEGDQFALNLVWHEPIPLQNRSLFLWSLWRPWQPVINLPIPDEAQGHHQVFVDKAKLTGGDYRLGFAIVDPWVKAEPALSPPEGGSSGTIDFQVIPDQRFEYLKENAHAFDDHFELALASPYQNEETLEIQEISWCLNNIHLGTGRQILILKSHLEKTGQVDLLKQLGEGLIQPALLASLLNEVQEGSIGTSDLSGLMKYVPPVGSWSDLTCEELFGFDDRRWRIEALRGLVAKKPGQAVVGALSMIKNGSIGIEEAVELLFENKPLVIDFINYSLPKDITAQKILEFLRLYNPYSGLPTVRAGTWVRSNAGWGKIESIQEITSHVSVDKFMENQGFYKLVVRLHIEIDPDFLGERVVIDMKENTLAFQRARLTYVCEYCQEFMSASREMYKSHIALCHPGKYPTPPTSNTTFTYSVLEFNHSRK